MLGVILSHAAMLLTFRVVLVVVGLTVVFQLISHIRKNENVGKLAEIVTRPVLVDIFPLILLSMLTAVDPTHVIVLIFYYLAALLIIIRALLELSNALKRS